jgi:UDP-glucose 4-epimerase
MKAIVTGGSGFIGGHIVDELISKNYEVIVIDNESSPFHDKFYHNDAARYYKLNILDEKIEELFRGVDHVFHLAAESRIQPTIENPCLAAATNYLGTCKILKLSYENGIERVLYSSTSSAYGLQPAPHTEDLKVDCLNPYSYTKVAGEQLCKMYHKMFGLNTVIFRYFNVYGPREPVKGQYAPVVGRFLKQYRSHNKMTVVKPGTQSRDYIHVSDIVKANILAAECTNKGAFGQVFNIGTGKTWSVLGLAGMIADQSLLDYESIEEHIEWLPERQGEAEETLAHTYKAETYLNFRAEKKLEDYIKEELTKL